MKAEDLTRMPHNSEAEQIFLGALLADNQQVFRVSIRKECFFEPVHGRIFEAISKIVHAGNVATPVTLKNQFNLDPALVDIGGAGYLAKLVSIAIAVPDIRQYEHIIADLHRRRQLISTLDQGLRDAFAMEKGLTVREISDTILGETIKISDDGGTLKIRSHAQVTDVIIDNLAKELPCFSTGIKGLDNATEGGFYSKKSYAVTARPKNGKTVLMSTISMNMAMADIPHLYIALEMGDEEIHQRNIARVAGQNAMAFKHKRKDESFIGEIINYRRTASKTSFFLNAPGLSFPELQRLVLSASRNYHIKGFFLDYIQLVRGKSKGENDAQHMDNVAQWIAEICRREDIWCCYAAQLNREGYVRGSDGIIQAADQVYRIEYDKQKGTAWMEQIESRYTPHGNIGSKEEPGLRMHKNGPHFKDIHDKMDSMMV